MITDYLQEACKLKGDIAEIGLGVGGTTQILLKYAKEHNKIVLGVDPFEEDWENMPESYGTPYRYGDFKKCLVGYEKNFVLCKENSLSNEAEQFLKRPLCFAYVDGLQYKNAVLSDLNIVNHAEIICVDDYDRLTGISEVPLAIKEYLNKSNRKLINLGRWAILIK